MSENRRNTFRCNPPGVAHALLKRGRWEESVELLNQSADGFAVAGQGLKVDVGQEALLCTHRGWSQVEITRRTVEGTRITLGLRRMEDLLEPWEQKAFRVNRVTWSTGAAELVRGVTPLSLAGLLALYAALGFWAAVLLMILLG